MKKKSGFGKEGLKKGKWSAREDQVLKDYVKKHGPGKWGNVARETGLKRCGKSVRLRWMNYLRPDIKHGKIAEDEEDLIIRMHKLVGKRWALIAGRIPGRTDNEIKNYWNSTLSKKLAQEKREDSEVCRNEIIKENLSFPIVDDGHRNPNKCDEVTKEGEEGALMCFASNVCFEEKHRCLGTTTMNPNEGVDIGCVANNDIQPNGKELNYKAMLWSDIGCVELDGGQLDMSEFLQTDFSKFWEESDIFKSFEVGGCSTIHEWPNNWFD